VEIESTGAVDFGISSRPDILDVPHIPFWTWIAERKSGRGRWYGQPYYLGRRPQSLIQALNPGFTVYRNIHKKDYILNIFCHEHTYMPHQTGCIHCQDFFAVLASSYWSDQIITTLLWLQATLLWSVKTVIAIQKSSCFYLSKKC
jgi:hypothetical protein